MACNVDHKRRKALHIFIIILYSYLQIHTLYSQLVPNQALAPLQELHGILQLAAWPEHACARQARRRTDDPGRQPIVAPSLIWRHVIHERLQLSDDWDFVT